VNVHVLRNLTNGKVVATRVGRASNPWTRGVGLLGRARLSPDEGLWIEHCSAVHTMFMRAIIDLYFLDKDGKVLRMVHAAKPYRLLFSCRESESVVELGTSPETGRDVLVGDRLILE
jgi:uncharacterized membrane protein (UPF0127 family)